MFFSLSILFVLSSLLFSPLLPLVCLASVFPSSFSLALFSFSFSLLSFSLALISSTISIDLVNGTRIVTASYGDEHRLVCFRDFFNATCPVSKHEDVHASKFWDPESYGDGDADS